MRIEIKDHTSSLVFKEFRKQVGWDQGPRFLHVKVSFTSSMLSVKTDLDYELSDFKDFYNDLTKMQVGIFRTFYFQHLDERLRLKLHLDERNRIKIDGELLDESYMNVVNFQINIDQSYIPSILLQIERVLEIGKATN